MNKSPNYLQATTSIIISVLSGLLIYQGYTLLVQGLNPLFTVLLGLIISGSVYLALRLALKSQSRTISFICFFIFAILLPTGLILSKKWPVNKDNVRTYHKQ